MQAGVTSQVGIREASPPYAREAQRGLRWQASKQARRRGGAADAASVEHGGKEAAALTAAWGAARSRTNAAPGPPWSLQHGRKRAAAWQLPPALPHTASTVYISARHLPRSTNRLEKHARALPC